METVRILCLAFALYALFILLVFAEALIKFILKKIGIVKSEIKNPLFLFKSDKEIKTWAKVISFAFGLICIYGTQWGFSTTPGALFEKPKYTTYYNGYASLDDFENSKSVVVQITRDNGYDVNNVFFLPEGRMEQIDDERIENPKDLFGKLEVRDRVSGFDDCYWSIELTNLAEQQKVAALNYNKLTKSQWIKIADNGTALCCLCDEIYDESTIDSYRYNWDDSYDGAKLVCENCRDIYSVYYNAIISVSGEYLLNEEYSVWEMNEIIAEYARWQSGNGMKYWDMVIPNIRPLCADCVYWTYGGKSYHSTDGCVALLSSGKILNGTLDEAFAYGKTDPCSKCVGY